MKTTMARKMYIVYHNFATCDRNELETTNICEPKYCI